jgi:hypothetical protein
LTAKMLRPVAAAAPARGRCRGRPAGGSAGPGACSREPGGEARTPGAGSGVIGGRARVRRPAGCLGHAGWHLAAGDDRGRGRVREQKATNPAGSRVCCCLGLGRALDCARPGAGRRAAELATRSSLQAQGGVSALLVDHAQEAGLAREEREGDTKELAIPILQRLLYSFPPLLVLLLPFYPTAGRPTSPAGGGWVSPAVAAAAQGGQGGAVWRGSAGNPAVRPASRVLLLLPPPPPPPRPGPGPAGRPGTAVPRGAARTCMPPAMNRPAMCSYSHTIRERERGTPVIRTRRPSRTRAHERERERERISVDKRIAI